MTQSLIVIDTDRIKDYVFGTNRLRDIRGASATLDELNRHTMPNIVKDETNGKYEKVYSNGGVGEFVVPKDSVAPIARRISLEYMKYGASATWASVELPTNYSIDETDVAETVSKLAYDLQIAKKKHRKYIALSHSFFRTCDACHEEVASFKDRNDEDSYICTRCRSKRNKFKQIKEDTPKYLQSEAVKDGTLRWKLLEKLKKLDYPFTDKIAFPDEIGDISKEGDGYIALIYADGNDMHRHIANLKTLKDHQGFSDKIDSSMYDALSLAIKDYLHPVNNIFPFDILLLGGDDLIIVCRAKEALNVAIKICKEFYKKTKGHSLSVGVAFAHTNFPIRLLLRIAESLLKTAKVERSNLLRKAKKENEIDSLTRSKLDGLKNGAINFMRISSSSSLLYEDFLADVLENEQSDDKFVRTFRPYSPDQLGKLLHLGRRLKGSKFPKSKLEYLGQALFADKFNSMLEALYIYSHTNKEQKKLLHEAFNFYPELESIPPWQY